MTSGLTPPAGLETFGLAAVVWTLTAADCAALCALAISLLGGKLGKLDLSLATVFGNSDGLRPFFCSIPEYVSNCHRFSAVYLFNTFGPVVTSPGG